MTLDEVSAALTTLGCVFKGETLVGRRILWLEYLGERFEVRMSNHDVAIVGSDLRAGPPVFALVRHSYDPRQAEDVLITALCQLTE